MTDNIMAFPVSGESTPWQLGMNLRDYFAMTEITEVSRYFHAHDQRITSITQAASAHQ